jgi:hypothetical protein
VRGLAQAKRWPGWLTIQSDGHRGRRQRSYRLVDGRGEQLGDEEALAEWQRGQAATLAELPDATLTIVLADTPRMRSNPASCLQASPGDVSACVTPRSAALGQPIDDAERSAAEAAGAAFELNDGSPLRPCPDASATCLCMERRPPRRPSWSSWHRR